MIRTKTVFVVGAGASCEVNLPLGPDLTKQIADALRFRGGASGHGPRELVRGAITNLGLRTGEHRRDSNSLFRKALDVSSGLATAASIDAFIDNHSHDPDFALLGKLGIAACLIEAERDSKLTASKPGELLDMHAIADTWYARLFNIMAAGVKARSVEEMFTNVRFVVFNYDRCLEHFFQHAIASRFVMDLERAGQIVREHLRVIHPYGALGDLSGPSKVGYGIRLRGGTIGDGDAVLGMSEGLRTFTESQSERAHEVKQYMAQAKRAVFLGFAFHPQNVELLQTGTNGDVMEFRATTFKMSDSNRSEVFRAISRIVGNAHGELAHLPNAECRYFISDEELFLSR